MSILHIHTVVEEDGTVHLNDLPFRKGQRLELTVSPEPAEEPRAILTARDLLSLPIVGIWQDRADSSDAPAFARQLRDDAQNRQA